MDWGPAQPCGVSGRRRKRTPHLTLERTSRRLSQTGDPIWLLSLQLNQDTAVHFDAVSGRATGRPLTGTRPQPSTAPAGIYSVGAVEDLGPTDPAELGPIWIGIEPQFTTGRGHLGIHLDPSANRNADSGTLGCIGLIDRQSIEPGCTGEAAGCPRTVVKN